jgi:hypothetical protein
MHAACDSNAIGRHGFCQNWERQGPQNPSTFLKRDQLTDETTLIVIKAKSEQVLGPRVSNQREA